MASERSAGPSRALVVLAGLCGAIGVALSAAAAHRGGAFTGTAANFLLFHAAAVLAIGLGVANRGLRLGALVLVVGLLFFCGDLVSRDVLDDRLFPFAAPIGGTALILGWIVITVSGFFAAKG